MFGIGRNGRREIFDKLGIINSCLALTGNLTCNVEEDGSDEWVTASYAYESAVKYLLAEHDWKFLTDIVTLQRLGDADDDHYEDIYRKPQGCLGLRWVKQADCSLDWKIIGDQIYTTRFGDDAVKAEVVLRGDPSTWNPLFVKGLDHLVKAGIYRGLNEDPVEATRQEAQAEDAIAKAKSRTDREDKPRPMLRSRMLARRRGRGGYASPP